MAIRIEQPLQWGYLVASADQGGKHVEENCDREVQEERQRDPRRCSVGGGTVGGVCEACSHVTMTKTADS